jgi:hypothetical protein
MKEKMVQLLLEKMHLNQMMNNLGIKLFINFFFLEFYLMTHITKTIKGLKGDNPFKKNIETLIQNCLDLTNDTKTSELEFEVIGDDDISIGKNWTLIVKGFEKDIEGSVLRKFANECSAQKVIFVPKNGNILFKYYQQTQIKSIKSNTTRIRTVYEDAAKRTSKPLSGGILSIDKIPEYHEKGINSLLTIFFMHFKCETNIKVIIQDISYADDDDISKIKVLFQNISEPINIASLLQEKHGKGLICRPQSNGMIFEIKQQDSKKREREE